MVTFKKNLAQIINKIGGFVYINTSEQIRAIRIIHKMFGSAYNIYYYSDLRKLIKLGDSSFYKSEALCLYEPMNKTINKEIFDYIKETVIETIKQEDENIKRNIFIINDYIKNKGEDLEEALYQTGTTVIFIRNSYTFEIKSYNQLYLPVPNQNDLDIAIDEMNEKIQIYNDNELTKYQKIPKCNINDYRDLTLNQITNELTMKYLIEKQELS